MLPVDINRSRVKCTVEFPHVRLGFNYVRGLHREAAEAVTGRQPYENIEDLARRVPERQKAG